MICESCQQNSATVHLTEIVQKSKKETHLCEECAKERGVPHQAQFSVKEFLGGLGSKSSPSAAASSAAGPSSPDDEDAQKAAEAARAAQTEESFEPCPSCGMTFTEFRQSGRLGCHQDYEHFKRGLVPLLEKIHNASQHRGRVPTKIGARIERERQIADFQRQLDEAVGREEYERAAELRDKIRELEVQEKP